MYTLSPFVWESQDGYNLLVRAVNRSDIAAEKVARVYYGASADGLNFKMDDEPVIPPGPGDLDCDGCEDPTVALSGGTYYVYYTGWNQSKLRGELLMAAGPDIHHLEKRGIALESTSAVRNPKEATIVAVDDGTWRLFFEYARNDASCIGIATSASVAGPWFVQDDLFQARPNGWDCWHLSTGPVLMSNPHRPIMFYNGATRDAKWRIGWVAFDANFQRVVARGTDPLIVPHDRVGEDTDIAFAASCVPIGEQECGLYYSVADRSMYRAMLRCEPHSTP
ncbi:MAG: glycoside hydrolase family 130 protein [Vulcanimicrobiaceae bacterium]